MKHATRWFSLIILMVWATLGASSGFADDTDKIRRQLDRLNRALAESNELPAKTSETIEALRKDLFEAALATRDAKKVFDAAEKSIEGGGSGSAELEQFRTDIVAAGAMLRILRDRLESFGDIIDNNKKMVEDQNRDLENIARALDGRPALIQAAVDEQTKSLRKQVDELNKEIARRDERIAKLEKAGPAPTATTARPAAPAGEIGALLASGFDLLAAAQVSDALARFEQAIALDPASVDARAGQAACYFELNQIEPARDIIEAALEVDGKNARALGVKGALLFREGKNREARKVLERAVKADDTNAYNHNYLGVVLSESGRQEAAIESLTRAVELDPEYVTAIYNLSILLATAENPDLDRARYYYTRALALGSPRQPFMDATLGVPEATPSAP